MTGLGQLSSTLKHVDEVSLRQHVDFVKVYLLVHVIAGDEVGFNRRKPPTLDVHASVLTHAEGSNNAGTVKTTDLSTGIGLVANHVIHAVNIKLAADDFFQKAGYRLSVVLVLSVHQGEQPSKTLFSEDFPNSLPNGGLR